VKVLVVEDQDRLAAQLADTLTTPATPSTARATASARTFFVNTEHYDAVILDLGLPKVDGLTLLRSGARPAMPCRCSC
jgi:two-component system, OmpR family, response regulator